MLKLDIRPEADRDIIDIADFIAVDSIDAAMRFLEQLELTFLKLRSSPRIGRPAGFNDAVLSELRVCLVSRFRRYIILYRLRSGVIEVVRVLHTARNLSDLLGPR